MDLTSTEARVLIEYALGKKTAVDALTELNRLLDATSLSAARSRLEQAIADQTRRRDHDHATLNALAAILANADLLRFALERQPLVQTEVERQTSSLLLEAAARVRASASELTELVRVRREAGF